MKISLPLKILICIVSCIALGSASGLLAGSATTEWYNDLNKPFFQPPSWVFGPAWTLLYTLMGISLALIWNSADNGKQAALTLFGLQFFLNLLWSPFFFYFEKPTIALVVIIIMWILIMMTIKAFNKIDNRAAYLMIPYILWVSFATLLNAAIVYLN